MKLGTFVLLIIIIALLGVVTFNYELSIAVFHAWQAVYYILAGASVTITFALLLYVIIINWNRDLFN